MPPHPIYTVLGAKPRALCLLAERALNQLSCLFSPELMILGLLIQVRPDDLSSHHFVLNSRPRLLGPFGLHEGLQLVY